jgi:hypothetical protein
MSIDQWGGDTLDQNGNPFGGGNGGGGYSTLPLSVTGSTLALPVAQPIALFGVQTLGSTSGPAMLTGVTLAGPTSATSTTVTPNYAPWLIGLGVLYLLFK